MRKLIYTSIIASTLALSQNLYAHGENHLGPHKGYIRMPGAYHVEVVPKANNIQVLLLDINFKNPTVLNSHIKAKITNGKDAYVLRCTASTYYFTCPVSNNLLTADGKLTIESERQLSEGIPVEYPLPLNLQKS